MAEDMTALNVSYGKKITGVITGIDIAEEGQDFSVIMVGFNMKETTLVEINDLLDNCRSLALEGYLGDIDQAKCNLKNILTDVQKVRNLIYESTLIGGR